MLENKKCLFIESTSMDNELSLTVKEKGLEDGMSTLKQEVCKELEDANFTVLTMKYKENVKYFLKDISNVLATVKARDDFDSEEHLVCIVPVANDKTINASDSVSGDVVAQLDIWQADCGELEQGYNRAIKVVVL